MFYHHTDLSSEEPIRVSFYAFRDGSLYQTENSEDNPYKVPNAEIIVRTLLSATVHADVSMQDLPENITMSFQRIDVRLLQIIESIFHYTCYITPKRGTSLRDPSPRQSLQLSNTFFKKKWRAFGNAESDLTSPRFERQISRSKNERVSAQSTKLLNRLNKFRFFCQRRSKK